MEKGLTVFRRDASGALTGDLKKTLIPHVKYLDKNHQN